MNDQFVGAKSWRLLFLSIGFSYQYTIFHDIFRSGVLLILEYPPRKNNSELAILVLKDLKIAAASSALSMAPTWGFVVPEVLQRLQNLSCIGNTFHALPKC